MASVTSPSGLDDPRIWVTVVTRCGGLPRTPPPPRAAPLPAPRRRRRCVNLRQTDGGPQKPAGRLSKLKTAFYPAQFANSQASILSLGSFNFRRSRSGISTSSASALELASGPVNSKCLEGLDRSINYQFQFHPSNFCQEIFFRISLRLLDFFEFNLTIARLNFSESEFTISLQSCNQVPQFFLGIFIL